jgi:hypothetical protein
MLRLSTRPPVLSDCYDTPRLSVHRVPYYFPFMSYTCTNGPSYTGLLPHAHTLPYPGVFPLRVSQLSSDLTHLFCFLIALVMRTYKPITKPICRLLISLHKHLRSLSDSASLTQRSPLLTDSLLIDVVSHVYK